MVWQMSRVADRAHNDDTLSRALFYGLRKRVVEIALFKITAGRDVYNTNIVLLAMLKHPFEAILDILFADAPGTCKLYKYNIRIRCDAAIKSVRQRPVTRRHDRSHHPVPACNIR